MPNMSYCRFRNTLEDLQDCQSSGFGSSEELSEQEDKARKKLIKLCCLIAQSYSEEIGHTCEIGDLK